MKTEDRIRKKCNELAEMLIAKNKSYGDSALHPVKVFSKGNAEDNLNSRADDKLARIQNAPGAYAENEIWDLSGYLVLILLAREDQKNRDYAT